MIYEVGTLLRLNWGEGNTAGLFLVKKRLDLRQFVDRFERLFMQPRSTQDMIAALIREHLEPTTSHEVHLGYYSAPEIGREYSFGDLRNARYVETCGDHDDCIANPEVGVLCRRKVLAEQSRLKCELRGHSLKHACTTCVPSLKIEPIM